MTAPGARGPGVVGLGSFLPGPALGMEHFGGAGDALAANPLLRAPTARHHVDRDTRAGTMVESASREMFAGLGDGSVPSVDLVITNVLLPDNPITGCGAEVAQRLELRPEWVIDLHNGGCASFPYMLKLAGALMRTGEVASALICNVQNTAGQIYSQPSVKDHPAAAVPGDGCGVAYLQAGAGAEILATRTHNVPESAADMGIATADGRRYWEAGDSDVSISFEPRRFAEIIERGNRLVPETVRALCADIDVTPAAIDILVTNQPNRTFLRNWREELGIPPERHVDTFDECGNLYGAGAPVTLAAAAGSGRIADGDLVVLAGFAHAGDFAAAAAIRWGP